MTSNDIYVSIFSKLSRFVSWNSRNTRQKSKINTTKSHVFLFHSLSDRQTTKTAKHFILVFCMCAEFHLCDTFTLSISVITYSVLACLLVVCWWWWFRFAWSDPPHKHTNKISTFFVLLSKCFTQISSILIKKKIKTTFHR